MPGTFTYTKSTNIVVVTGGTSGSPADFASFVAADRAGSVTLLAAWAPISNTKALTYQITPVELRALLISFVVASKTPGTDYIFITGTDFRDNAQTEAIDVSAGNGTYVSTKYWRTITNIDCSDNAAGGGTVWADGTVAVTQPQWGVIWDYENRQYKISSHFTIGNGSTATYFKSLKEQVYFKLSSMALGLKANATLQLGELIDASTHRTKNGSVWQFLSSTWFTPNVGSTLLLYGSVFLNEVDTDKWESSGNATLYNVLLQGFGMRLLLGTYDLYNVISCYSYYGIHLRATVSIDKLTIWNPVDKGIMFNTAATAGTYYRLSVLNPGTKSLYVQANKGGNFIDCEENVFSNVLINSLPDGEYIKRQYTCNIHISDKDGNNLAGASVTCKDKDENDAFTTQTTGADGTITEQIITYQQWWYDGGEESETLSPHKFTISKAGYQTLVLENITVDHPIVWHLELQTRANPQYCIGV